MDSQAICLTLGRDLRAMRVRRGMTQTALAALAGLPRQKIIAIEKGADTVAVGAYAKVLGALDCGLTVVAAAMPTLDEVGDLFE